jgi:Reverse transcriptase (RNA-dependent DNA polymerase)
VVDHTWQTTTIWNQFLGNLLTCSDVGNCMVLSHLLSKYFWHSIQINFILAYPQADVESALYMHIPKGFAIKGGNRKTHVVKILKNLYGQKQAGRVWNQHLHKALIKLGWIQSNIMFVVYIHDGIFLSPNKEHIMEELQLLQKVH